jgi:hypothetical protein
MNRFDQLLNEQLLYLLDHLGRLAHDLLSRLLQLFAARRRYVYAEFFCLGCS